MEEGGKRRLSRVAPDSQAIFVPTFLNTCCMRWKCARDLQRGSRRQHEHIRPHAFRHPPLPQSMATVRVKGERHIMQRRAFKIVGC
jgi:hypothetical protein